MSLAKTTRGQNWGMGTVVLSGMRAVPFCQANRFGGLPIWKWKGKPAAVDVALESSLVGTPALSWTATKVDWNVLAKVSVGNPG